MIWTGRKGDYVVTHKEEISEIFNTLEEAGAFWDAHSLADYKKHVKSVEIDFQFSKRTRYIAVPEKTYRNLALRAHRRHTTVRGMLLELAK